MLILIKIRPRVAGDMYKPDVNFGISKAFLSWLRVDIITDRHWCTKLYLLPTCDVVDFKLVTRIIVTLYTYCNWLRHCRQDNPGDCYKSCQLTNTLMSDDKTLLRLLYLDTLKITLHVIPSFSRTAYCFSFSFCSITPTYLTVIS